MTSKICLIKILDELFKIYKLSELATILNLSNGTLTRWIKLQNVPNNYEFDLLKLLDKNIDYTIYSSKQKDQFFTPKETAIQCYNIFCNEIQKYNDDIKDFIFIEPSAGDNSFTNILPQNTISMDIEPLHKNIIKQDFLQWTPIKKNKYIVFGNPPFGLRGHMALQFINHSYNFAEYVCFILPQLFESDGKGSPRKRVQGYNLIFSIKLQSNFYEPDKTEIKINTIFQIWSKNHVNLNYKISDIKNDNIKIYSMSDGGNSSSTRNIKMIGKCDIYVPSTCFGKENMKWYNDFNDLPNKRGYGIVLKDKKKLKKKLKINLCDIAFLSTNSAYNLRSSQIMSLFN